MTSNHKLKIVLVLFLSQASNLFAQKLHPALFNSAKSYLPPNLSLDPDSDPVALSKISTEYTYLKVGTVYVALIIYGIILVTVPTSLVLLFFFARFKEEPEQNAEAEAGERVLRDLSLMDSYNGALRVGNDCLRRLSCDISGLGRENTLRGSIVRYF
jgi:hypothetical protein